MATAFENDAFQNDGFQIDGSTPLSFGINFEV